MIAGVKHLHVYLSIAFTWNNNFLFYYLTSVKENIFWFVSLYIF